MNELSKYILTLLRIHGYAIIPGFGGFVLRHVPSSLSKDLRKIKAPSSEIAFNRGMTVNDGYLIQSYMVDSDLSYPAAERKVKSVVAEMNDCLYGKGVLDLQGVGCLKMSVSGAITFISKNISLVDARLYGLSDFEMPLLSDIKNKKTDSRFAENRKTITGIWNYAQYAAACIAVMILYFSSSVSLDNGSLHRYDNMASMLPSTMFSKRTAEHVRILEDNGDFTDEEDIISEKNEEQLSLPLNISSADAEVKEQVEDNVTETAKNKKYHIVVASLSVGDDAESIVSNLKKEGYRDAMTLAGDNRVRIVLKSYASFDDAVKGSEEIRKTTRFKEAWVLTKRI